MTIATIIAGRTDSIASVAPEALVSDVVSLLAERRIGAVPVLDGAKLVGILSERDVLRILARDGASALNLQAKDLMTSPVVTVEPSTTVIGSLSLMTRRRMRHLPVVEGGRMIGFVSIGDLVKRRIDQIEAEAMAMREYITSA
jgi:CBS domain-containing protein